MGPKRAELHLAQKPETQGEPEDLGILCQMHLSQQNHLAQFAKFQADFIVNYISELGVKRMRFGFLCQMTDKNR